MKLRRLVRYSAGTMSLNPGAAGAQRQPCINSEEVLQVYSEETEKWADVPVVQDRQSLEKAQRDKYRSK
jgi:hypothetical protein